MSVALGVRSNPRNARRSPSRKRNQFQPLKNSVLISRSPQVWRKNGGESRIRPSGCQSQSSGSLAKARRYWASLRAGLPPENVGPGRTGGEGGIRTHGTLSRTHAFQACALNHSATCPFWAFAPWRGANRRNGAIYTQEFLPINPNLTVF